MQRTEQGDHILLVAEKLVSDRTELPLRELRMHVLERIARAIPFLEEHLRVVDSVHDGLPIWRYDSDGVRHEVPRSRASARPPGLSRWCLSLKSILPGTWAWPVNRFVGPSTTPFSLVPRFCPRLDRREPFWPLAAQLKSSGVRIGAERAAVGICGRKSRSLKGFHCTQMQVSRLTLQRCLM